MTTTYDKFSSFFYAYLINAIEIKKKKNIIYPKKDKIKRAVMSIVYDKYLFFLPNLSMLIR